jgi:hypothetical protein
MPKSGVSRRTRRDQAPPGRAELAGAVEGQIEEIYHELAVQVKRMRRLQEQADELRTTLLLWIVPSAEHARRRAPASRAERR